jgi:hypothetical protein
MQADVFLSYAEEDRARAGAVSKAQEALGWAVWWDREIAPGSTWRETIERAIEGTRCMVVLWSASSISSRWVHEEAEEGLARARLVPVLIEPVRPPIGFRSVQACDLSGWDGNPKAADFVSLTEAISALAGPPQPVPAPPSESPPLSDSPRRGLRYAWGAGIVMAALALVVAGMRWSVNSQSTTDASPVHVTPSARIHLPEPGAVPTLVPPAVPPEGAVHTNPPPDLGQPVAPRVEVPGAAARTEPLAPRIAPKAEARVSRSALSERCISVLERMQLGEQVSDIERKECTR